MTPALLIVGECLVMQHAGGRPPDPSGAPAIAAWVAARLGVETAFVGGVGADANGALLREALSDAGVRTDGLVTVPHLRTATARVEYFADGSRAFGFDVVGTAATAVRPGDLGTLPEVVRWLHVSGSAVLFGGTTAETVTSAVARAVAAGAVVSIDPNLRAELADPTARAALRELCVAAHVLFPSEGELESLALDEDELVARGTVVCRTMAEAGARVRTNGIDVRVAAVAEPHEVVDPDGAGDTFAAAVVAARLRGHPWDDAVEVASRVVARAIAVQGPMSAPLSAGDLA